MASPLSSPQQPMDHVFLRGHSPPKSTRPLPSVHTIEPYRFYAHRGDAVRDRFFEGDLMALEEAPDRASATWNPVLVHRRDHSSRVKSGCLETSVSSQSAYCSNGDVLPPRGLAAQHPVSRKHLTHLTAALGLISNCSAASRREAPLSTRAMTRPRISAEYAFGIVRPPRIESMPTNSPIYRPLGIPDSIGPEHALARATYPLATRLARPLSGVDPLPATPLHADGGSAFGGTRHGNRSRCEIGKGP